MLAHDLIVAHPGTVVAGTKLGRYQILRHLADGGMAQVLLARSQGIEGFERHVVIKRIHADQARDRHYVDMFLDEARLAASLHHHNIVQVHDVGQEGGEYFFAMEYVHGEDLRKLLTHLNGRHEQLPLQHVVTIVGAAAAALHYAHEMRGPDRKPLGIVHRDVSPANILVGYDGNVKVVDFGIAKAALRSAETRSGTLKGKVAYMAPEQCMGAPVDRRSDVFALGIVLWELATVRRLFKGASDFLTMTAIVSGKVPSPSEHRVDLPPVLEDIILKALAPKAEERYQTCDEMRAALEAFAQMHNLRTSTAALGDWMRGAFGERPEPWLVESDEPVIEMVDVDFDGSNSGVFGSVDPATLPIPDLVFDRNSSPLMKARARAKTHGDSVFPTPLPGAVARPVSEGAAPDDDSGWGARGDVPTTASGGVVKVTAPRPAAPRSRRPWLLLGVIGLALGVGAVWLVAKGSGDGGKAVPPPSAPPPPPPSIEQPAPAAAPPAAPVEQPPEPTPPEPAQEATPIAKPAAAPVRPKPNRPKPDANRPKPDTNSKAKPSWDPNALFPK